jgi:hypothetical protein
MSENTTEVIQLSDSEIDQIRESASCASLCDSEKMISDEGERESEGENEGCYHTGEKRTEAANGDVIVGREKRFEVRIVDEFSEG